MLEFSHPAYSIEKEIGRGAHAIVYEARHKRLDRIVALKVVNLSMLSAESRRRFQREAIIMAKLEHKNIVPVYELLESDNDYISAIAMRYIDGGTLSGAQDLLIDDCIGIVAELADALAYAHSKNVLHRDVKPDNILLDGRAPILTDFGIARQTDQHTKLTRTGALLGTPEYMSPEQISGQAIDERSDLYSLGIVFYELLTGVRPFQSDSPFATGILHLTAKAPPLPIALNSFQTCINQLLEKDKHRRINSARELNQVLEKVRSTLPWSKQTPISQLRSGAREQVSISNNTTAERRQLTIVFCQIAGYSQLVDTLDAETLREFVQQFHTTTDTIVQRFGGHIAQYSTDGVQLYFGYPIAHENDASRAVHACREISRAVTQYTTTLCNLSVSNLPESTQSLSIRTGVHTGLVIVGGNAPNAQRQTLATGSAPLIAERIQNLAPARSIWVSRTTASLLEGMFTLSPASLSEDMIANISPESVFEVTGADSSHTRFRAARQNENQDLFGRDREIAALHRIWLNMKHTRGASVLVVGDAGVGKSCLFEVFLSQCQMTTPEPIFFQCSPYHSDSALYPVARQISLGSQALIPSSNQFNLKILKQYLQLDDKDTQIIGDLLSETLTDVANRSSASTTEQTITPQQKRDRVLDALIRTIHRRSLSDRFVLVVEDLHWADPTTLELIQRLIAKLDETPVLLLLTARPEFNTELVGNTFSERLDLKGLKDESISKIIYNTAWDAMIPSELVSSIVAKSEGIPLYAEELTKSLTVKAATPASKPVDSVDGNTDDIQVPAALHDALISRLDRLFSAKEVAQAAACIGREFSPSLLKKVLTVDEDTFNQSLYALQDAEIVRHIPRHSSDTFQFSHALLRDIAHASLLNDKRRDIHRRVYAALATGHQPAHILAHHATEAKLYDAAEKQWTKAGMASTNAGAYVEAMQHFNKAIECCRQLTSSVPTYLRELENQVRLGHASTAFNGFAHPTTVQSNFAARELLNKVSDTPNRFPVLYGHWVIQHALGNNERALADANGMLKESRRTNQRVHKLMAFRVCAASHTMMGNLATASEIHNQFVTHYDNTEDARLAWQYGTDPYIAANANFSMLLLCQGNMDALVTTLHKIHRRAHDLDHTNSLAFALAHLALVSAIANVKDTELFVKEAVALMNKHPMPAYNGHITGAHGIFLYNQGQFDKSLDQMEISLATIEKTKTYIYCSILYGYYAACLEKLHRPAEAEEAFGQSMRLAQDNKDQWTLAEAIRVVQGAKNDRSLNGDDRTVALRKAATTAEKQGAYLWRLRCAVTMANLAKEADAHNDAKSLLTSALATYPSKNHPNDEFVQAQSLLQSL